MERGFFASSIFPIGHSSWIKILEIKEPLELELSPTSPPLTHRNLDKPTGACYANEWDEI